MEALAELRIENTPLSLLYEEVRAPPAACPHPPPRARAMEDGGVSVCARVWVLGTGAGQAGCGGEAMRAHGTPRKRRPVACIYRPLALRCCVARPNANANANANSNANTNTTPRMAPTHPPTHPAGRVVSSAGAST